ncbi:DUF2505 domain-containing protein [Nocardioides solisilvae]|uniref:DUF2505 domain-containing protein n=1 Tax=Nocardioides solisilvae TaxID=1542435 RepID=UPI000D745512|nr:DUF2505 domain-containing protein [Nocardioides solisilvae]
MTKRLTHQLTYPAPLEDVAAMLRDPAFRERVCVEQRVVSHDVSVDPGGATTVVRVARVQEARGIPSFAAKVVGERIEVVQVETWHDHERADYRVEIPGKPGEISGTAVLTESGGTTTETVSLDVTVRIPLLGGRLEGLVHDLVLKALQVENRVGLAHLGGS